MLNTITIHVVLPNGHQRAQLHHSQALHELTQELWGCCHLQAEPTVWCFTIQHRNQDGSSRLGHCKDNGSLKPCWGQLITGLASICPQRHGMEPPLGNPANGSSGSAALHPAWPAFSPAAQSLASSNPWASARTCQPKYLCAAPLNM